MAKTGDIVFGVITGVHGVRGEVRLKSFTGDPLALKGYSPFDTPAGKIEISALRPVKQHFVARLKGISDRNQAELLKGVELRVERARLPQTRDDEFYYADLTGLVARDTQGAEIGMVIGVENFGAGDLLEVRKEKSQQTMYFPFTRQVVPVVDVKAGMIVLDPPDEVAGKDGPVAGQETP